MSERIQQMFDEHAASEGWTVVYRFTIAHLGWEMDNDSAIAREPDGTLHVLTTNHGGLRVDEAYSDDPDGPVPSVLECIRKIRDEHRKWAQGLDTAVALLEAE